MKPPSSTSLHHIDPLIRTQVLATICEYSQEGIFILDSLLNFVWLNQSLSMILGYTEMELLGESLSVVAYENDNHSDSKFLKQVKNALSVDDYFFSEFVCHTRYDVQIDANLTLWKVEVNNQFFFSGAVRDVRGSAATKRTLQKVLNFNQITGLPNRTFFLSQLSEYMLDTYQDLVVARFNIDRFRAYINALDENHINELLKQLVGRIHRLQLPHLKLFAHFGVDDFALLLEISDAEAVRDELEQIMQQFELPFLAEEEPVYLHISMGVSCYPQDASQMDVLLRYAEKSMSYAKQEGDTIIWYSQSLGLETLPNLKLEAQIRQALSNGEFIAYYQPKFDLRTKKLSGFETLVRWQHPVRGLLTPNQFIPTIIESRLSFELFEIMLSQASEQLSIWLSEGLGFGLNICINTDAAEFRHPGFLQVIRDKMGWAKAHPNFNISNLVIEMTESSLMIKDEQSINAVEALKSMGLSVALDDFGTGYASLSYLHHYPFDYVKIDKSFVDDITNSQKRCDIVHTIVTMAHRLNMQIIAEGIESQAQADLLTELGCEFGQGFYFAKPMDALAATELLRSNPTYKDC